MSLIVKMATRWLKGCIVLFGIYVVLYGHLTPGGGFTGGVIMACGFILLTLASGQKKGSKTLSKVVASELASAGALLFLGGALLAVRIGGAFLGNFTVDPEGAHTAVSGGIIEIYEVAIGFIVCMSLYTAFSVLAAVHVRIGSGQEKGDN